MESKAPIDVIEEAFKRIGHAVHYAELLKFLESEMGYHISGKNPLGNLSAKLSNSPRFKKHGEGKWRLAEWGDLQSPKQEEKESVESGVD